MALFDPDKYRTTDKEEREVDKLVVAIDGADETGLSAASNAQDYRRVGELYARSRKRAAPT